MSRLEEIVLKTLAIVLVPVVAGLALYVKILWTDNEEAKPEFNGYVAPRELETIVNYAKNVTVTLDCKVNYGSGFSFELDPKFDFATWNFQVPESERSIIITNHHVVEECVEPEDRVKVTFAKGKSLFGKIVGLDDKNDLAALVVNKKIDWTVSTPYEMRSGYWVIAAGSPFEMEGTVTFGNIIKLDGERIYTSASLNKGNSGGPLLDNEGYVVGVNTGYRAVAQNLNWAVDINKLCERIAKCEFGELGKGP
jgi:serine protease Do